MGVVGIAKNVHVEAWNQAKEVLPELELNEIIDNIGLVVRKEKTVKEVSKLFADRYKEPVEVYEKAFLNVLVQEGIKVIPDQKLNEVVGEEFANKIIEAGKQISENFKKYSKGELKVSELIENLKPQLTDIVFDVLDAHGYDKKQLVALQDAFMQANWLMVSEIAFTEVYKNTSWDAARFEVCAHKYCDLSEYGYGVSLMNDCKYGHAIHDGVISLTLLKCGTFPDPDADNLLFSKSNKWWRRPNVFSKKNCNMCIRRCRNGKSKCISSGKCSNAGSTHDRNARS